MSLPSSTTPISEIQLIKCPALSPTYRDSYYFNGLTLEARRDAQTSYFNNLSPKTLSSSQITRISNNQVKVPFPVEEVREYNYMCITNQKYNETTSGSPTDRRFYCFIMNVEYISNMCTLITFKVDVIQTYLFDDIIREAFVERCHADSDNLFEHREAEPFGIENYTVDSQTTHLSSFYLIVAVASGTGVCLNTYITSSSDTPDYTTEEREYHFVGYSATQKIVSGVEHFIFRCDTTTYTQDMIAFQNLLNSLNVYGKMDAIADMYLVPEEAIDYDTSSIAYHRLPDVFASDSTSWDVSALKPTATTQISSYTPTNKKLYNYPYCFMRVTNNQNGEVDLKWEEFSSTPTLKIVGSWFGGGALTLYPQAYEVSSGDNNNYKLSLTGFPIAPYTTDVYKQWKAQKTASEFTSAVISGFAGITASSLVTAVNPVAGAMMEASAVGSLISNLGGIVSDSIEASKKPNQPSNTTNEPNVALNNGKFGYTAMRVSLSKHEAEQIDNYFTMFGYAYNKILNVRTYMNNSKRTKFFYIKTNGFNVQGNIPAEYKLEFNKVFNNGITFWKTTATVGDYSNNNISNS